MKMNTRVTRGKTMKEKKTRGKTRGMRRGKRRETNPTKERGMKSGMMKTRREEMKKMKLALTSVPHEAIPMKEDRTKLGGSRDSESSLDFPISVSPHLSFNPLSLHSFHC